MWAPHEHTVYGAGWVELSDFAFRSDHVRIEVDGRRFPTALVRFEVPHDLEIQNSLERSPFLRVFVHDGPNLLMAIGWGNGVSGRYSQGGFRSVRESTVELRPHQVSKITLRPQRGDEAEVVHSVRVLPPLGAFGVTRLQSGVIGIGPFESKAERGSQFVRCGDTDVRMEVSYDSDRERRADDTGDFIHLDAHHVVVLRRGVPHDQDAVAVLEDLKQLADFIVAFLSCLYRCQVNVVASATDMPTQEPRGDMHLDTLHCQEATSLKSLRSSIRIDDRVFPLVQEVVSAWPSVRALLYTVQLLSASYDTFTESAFLTRYIALEQIVADWFVNRGGRERLRKEQAAGGPLWPRDRKGRPIGWKDAWNGDEIPTLSKSLWTCMEHVGASGNALFGDPAGGTPAFITLRNGFVHGRRPASATPNALFAAAEVTAATSLRILHAIMGLDVGTGRAGDSMWYFRTSAPELISSPSDADRPPIT